MKDKILILVEITMVILVIGTLAVIILPAFIGDTKERYGIEAVKSNMILLQQAIDTYGQKHKGKFPDNLDQLSADAKAGKYDKTIFNPFTYVTGETEKREISITLRPEEYAIISNITSFPNYKGKVAYYPVSKKMYAIYGFDKQGGFIKEGHKIFTLTNAK